MCRPAFGKHQETKQSQCLFEHMHRAIGLLLLLKTGWKRLTSLVCKLAACILVMVMGSERK